jgi:hypothetical protein
MPPPLKEPRKLTFIDIVMNADAATIKAAYEARVDVDKLLALRDDAYRQIAELETKVEDLMGQPGLFVFPPPPLAVAGLEAATPRPRKASRPADGGEASPPPAAVTAEAVPPPAGHAPAGDEPAPAAAEKAPAPKPDSADRTAPRGGGSAPRSH